MGVQRIDCGHGQLARQCPICERDQRITELEDALRARQIDVNSAALSDAHKRIAELERAFWPLTPPTREAREVISKSIENHTGSTPFDRRAVPNQWLLNERGVTARVCAELERHANERRDMVECTDEMSLRTMHELAQEGCRFFYLRPKS